MSSPIVTEPQPSVPLCVDLDGTLIKTDLLWESLVQLLKHQPLYSLCVPFWCLRGRAHLKAQLAARVRLDAAGLPYNEPLVEYLREQKSRRPLVLVTASDASLAQAVANHLGFFSDVLASDGKTNLRGKNKGEKLVERFGGRGFDYAGNSTVDLPVWKQARQALVVNGTASLAARAGQCTALGRTFEPRASWWHGIVQALRPHHWVKNLIIFVPLLTSHRWGDLAAALNALVAFFVFSWCASGVYVLNDLLDLEADRHHPTKRQRPFAAGNLPLPLGLVLAPVLLITSGLVAWKLSGSFAAVLAIYLILTTSYSWRLKQVPLVDVFCLAGLYTIRLIAGHEATEIVYSFWLLVFSMFIFLSLALVKRFLELKGARQRSGAVLKGRGYVPGDTELVATMGMSSGYLSVLVLALYVNGQEVHLLYHRPLVLLLICPVLFYWISRVWLLAHRGQMDEDPIVFALKDRVSYVTAALAFVFLWLATGH
jgi:4-hydroxybenzoate polyprenyltransferase